MTTQEIVDIVLLNVNGGQLAGDAAVQRPEVETYVPIALSAALESHYRRERLNTLRVKGQLYSIPDEYFQSYQLLSPFKKDERGNWYGLLPSAPFTIPGYIFVRSVKTVSGFEYAPLTETDELALVEGYIITSSIDGITRIIFTDKPNCDVIIRAILKPGPKSDINFPAEVVDLAVKNLIDHFRKQALQPTEVNIDNTFVNDANKQ